MSNAQAADRLKKYGPNALVEGKKKGVLQVFLEQFKDLLVVILIVAAIISMLSGFLVQKTMQSTTEGDKEMRLI